ncbi:uncharacterized protein BCR38DRAFT_237572 [Pseudomassariella vexata]|uniref:Uncharacterized protein n=1 Tax=Pseudomassariella vexata TaxID=1141098 RepID=A0A1Y2DT25_9PEZI|nr:uncharacterized protein BCR38DRAFT_237572 [Pseudomassariella vexata]ORY62319.1 hypothetical protein BCR38DRAFT_237572 [Pseudomassariella vexata]
MACGVWSFFFLSADGNQSAWQFGDKGQGYLTSPVSFPACFWLAAVLSRDLASIGFLFGLCVRVCGCGGGMHVFWFWWYLCKHTTIIHGN